LLDVVNNNDNNNNRIGLDSSSITYHYLAGQKYCRRCEVYMFYNKGIFCPCCGMQLRTTPTNRRGKEKLVKYRLKQRRKTAVNYNK
jgi:uncharacterized Zn finger protein (UPF0148 family)